MAWAGDGFQFLLKGTPGRNYLIESSADLRSWQLVTTLSLDSETKEFREPSPAGTMFYRAQLVNDIPEPSVH
jgi:hypothetical protein